MYKKTIYIACILCAVLCFYLISQLLNFSPSLSLHLPNFPTSQPLSFLTSVAEATIPLNKSHSIHPPDKCHNLQFNLIMPSDGYVDGMEIVRGIVPIQIEMHPQFQGFGIDDGYGVFIAVDYKGVLEEDGVEFGQGNVLDITYQLDTTVLNNGTHLINVNVNDYYDHSGSLLMKVVVDN